MQFKVDQNNIIHNIIISSAADQYEMWQNGKKGSYYWTTDRFAYSYFKMMGSGHAIFRAPLWVPSYSTDPVGFIPDRNGDPNSAIELNTEPDSRMWLMLAEGHPDPAGKGRNLGCFDSESVCLMNPGTIRCKALGMTMCMWIMLREVCFNFTFYDD